VACFGIDAINWGFSGGKKITGTDLASIPSDGFGERAPPQAQETCAARPQVSARTLLHPPAPHRARHH
jgi:hypothetical protein